MSKPNWIAEEVVTHPVPQRQLGDAAIVAAFALSLLLVLQHFEVLSLPGFVAPPDGEGPVTFARIVSLPIGYFYLVFLTGILVRWVMARDVGVSLLFRWLVRCSALGAVTYLVLMTRAEYLCPYGGAIHFLYLVFWIVVELAQPALHRSTSALITIATGCALASSFLYLAVTEANRAIPGQDQQAFSQASDPSEIDSEASAGNDHDDASVASDGHDVSAESAEGRDGLPAKRMPYRLGSEEATIQLVVFYDYESPTTSRIDKTLQAVVADHGDMVSLTAMHYPLCRDCNFSVRETKHKYACTAARAAEAAGVVGGLDGFWKAHRWLCRQGGKVNEQHIIENADLLGIEDTNAFVEAMNSQEVLSAILSDTIDAQTRGIRTSPAVLLNGELLRGPNPENDVLRALATATNLNQATANQTGDATAPFEAAFTSEFPRDVQVASLLATVRIKNAANDSTGSGAVIATSGPFVYILTAKHVVAEATTVKVQTFSEASYPAAEEDHVANVVRQSRTADLALVRYASPKQGPEPLKVVPTSSPSLTEFQSFSVGCNGPSPPTCVADHVTRPLRIRRDDGTTNMMWGNAERFEGWTFRRTSTGQPGEDRGSRKRHQRRQGILLALERDPPVFGRQRIES